MFPLRDTIRSRSVPVVTWALIGINAFIFLFEISLGTAGSDRLLENLALIPANLSLVRPWTFITLLTSTFLHGSWFHLISNMWTLWIFGDNVEDRMGSVRYLVFYLFSGLAAGLVHVFFDSGSSIPTIGASGAIAGILGAYFVLFPRAKVITLIPIFFLWFAEIPAILYLGIWFLTQLSSGLLSLGAAMTFGGIAWWAHIGGFVFGVALVRIFTRRPRVHDRWYPDEYWPW